MLRPLRLPVKRRQCSPLASLRAINLLCPLRTRVLSHPVCPACNHLLSRVVARRLPPPADFRLSPIAGRLDNPVLSQAASRPRNQARSPQLAQIASQRESQSVHYRANRHQSQVASPPRCRLLSRPVCPLDCRLCSLLQEKPPLRPADTHLSLAVLQLRNQPMSHRVGRPRSRAVAPPGSPTAFQVFTPWLHHRVSQLANPQVSLSPNRRRFLAAIPLLSRPVDHQRSQATALLDNQLQGPRLTPTAGPPRSQCPSPAHSRAADLRCSLWVTLLLSPARSRLRDPTACPLRSQVADPQHNLLVARLRSPVPSPVPSPAAGPLCSLTDALLLNPARSPVLSLFVCRVRNPAADLRGSRTESPRACRLASHRLAPADSHQGSQPVTRQDSPWVTPPRSPREDQQSLPCHPQRGRRPSRVQSPALCPLRILA